MEEDIFHGYQIMQHESLVSLLARKGYKNYASTKQLL